MSRYNDLLKIIELTKPRSFVETGTWKGHNAVRMLTIARQYCDKPQYVGYDLFEDATPETDELEFNLKEHPTIAGAYAKILKKCPWAEVNLIKGDTRATLRSITADLAFIDGGHSLETIRHDYEALKHSRVVVFDDYYTRDENGEMPDITKFGCNELLKDKQHLVIHSQDRVRTGGIVNLAVVFGVMH